MSRRVLVLAVLLVLHAGMGARAQETFKEPLYVLLTDSEGIWSPEQQARFHPPAALGDEASVSTDWKELLRTRPFTLLSYQERVRLLGHPKRLLSSRWAGQYFSARHVLVLEPSEDNRIIGRLYDTLTGDEQPVVVSEDHSDSASARADALRQAAELAEVAAAPVLAHPESGLYHRIEANHLSPRVTYSRIPTAQRAEIYGFNPCRICYPESDRGSLYDDIDRRLGLLVSSTIESQYRVAPEGPRSERVDRIGRHLLRENRFLDQGYRFIVLDTDTINAFAAPTGPIYVTTGLLDILESDDELAAILGHELSHSERKHARKQYERSREAGVVGLLVTVATGIPWAQLGSSIISTVMVRGYSRGYELEADRDGMMTAYAAGYVPQDFLLVQQKLQALAEQKGGGPGWLRTHPRGEERLEQLEQVLEETAPARERLERLEALDPGTARYLKSGLLDPENEPGELDEYLALYQKVLDRVDRSEQSVPPPPTIDPGQELWDVLDNLLPNR